MRTLTRKPARGMAAIAMAAFGLFLAGEARAAEPACPENGAMVKNLAAPTYRAPCAQASVPQLTNKEAKRLAATAESREDHWKLARYYQAEADKLDAQAAGYEEAAAAYRRGPFVKNLMAPTAAGRYEYFAQGLREEAKSDRVLEQSHQKMAKAVAAL